MTSILKVLDSIGRGDAPPDGAFDFVALTLRERLEDFLQHPKVRRAMLISVVVVALVLIAFV